MITTKTSGSLTRIFKNGRHIGTVEAFGKSLRWTVSALYSPNRIRTGVTGSYSAARAAIISRATVNV